MRRVVVTGCGFVGARGCGLQAAREALQSGTPTTLSIDQSGGWHVRGSARLVASTAGSDLSAWISPSEARRMSLPSTLALAAARMALAGADLQLADSLPPAAVVMATTYGPLAHVERLVHAMLAESPTAASPSLFTESVANAPAAQVAIGCRALGTNVTLVQGEAGALRAVGRAAAEVASGRARVALAGVVEEVTPLLHAVLDRAGALARPDEAGLERALPFGRGRSGVLAAEGATVWVLESEEDARTRGVTPLARIAGSAAAFDPTAQRGGFGQDAEGLARSLRGLLARSGGAPPARIVSGAAGGLAGDLLEARVLRAAWSSEPLPAVLAPKGVMGDMGASMLAAALLALSELDVGAMPGVHADEALGVAAHVGSLPPVPSVLATTLAAGGGASWLLVERA